MMKNNGTVGTVKRRTRSQEILRQYMKNKGAVAATVVLAILLCILIWAQFHYNFEKDICGISSNVLQKASREHPMGTDHLGRDVMARLLYGGRWSLSLAIGGVVVSCGIGTIYGAVATYIGGKVESVMMRLVESIMMIPAMLLVIVLVAVLGTSTTNLIIAISIGGIPYSARLARSVILPLRNVDYVESARSIGASDIRILFFHILPNCISPLIVSITMRIGTNIINVAAYSFLGLGVEKPIPEWGTMLSEARNYLSIRPDLIFYPGLMIVTFTLIFNLIGDGLRDALDPKLRR